MEARVDAQHSRVRRLVEDCQELRRQQKVSEVVNREVGLQAVGRHFSGLRRAAMEGGGEVWIPGEGFIQGMRARALEGVTHRTSQ